MIKLTAGWITRSITVEDHPDNLLLFSVNSKNHHPRHQDNRDFQSRFSSKMEVHRFDGMHQLGGIFQENQVLEFHDTPHNQRIIISFYLNDTILNWSRWMHHIGN